MCYVSIISNEILKYSIHHEYTYPDVYVSHSCTGTLELSFSQTGGAYVPGEKKLDLVNSEKVKVMRPVFVNVKCWQRIWKSKPVSHYTHTCIWLNLFQNSEYLWNRIYLFMILMKCCENCSRVIQEIILHISYLYFICVNVWSLTMLNWGWTVYHCLQYIVLRHRVLMW